jgi:hypothetical protein
MDIKESGKRVFLSYAHQDLKVVENFRFAFLEQGYQVYSDYSEIQSGEPWVETLRYRLEASDFVIVFLSKHLFERDGLKFEYSQDFLNDIKRRNINLIPVKLDDYLIPSNFLEFELINSIANFDGPQKLLERVNNIGAISFEKLSSLDFEELIYSLLQNLDFNKIEWNRKVTDDGFDFIAEYYNPDPFGQRKKGTWLIECKNYNVTRFDLRSIKNVIERYKYIRRQDAKLVLITTSQFNSVAKEYIENIQQSDFVEISTIDGFQLKNILSKFPNLVHKFFPQ